MKMCIIEKKRKTIAKTLEVNFLLTRLKKNNCSRHNSMTKLCHKYLNMKIKEKWVEIIDLKRISSLT